MAGHSKWAQIKHKKAITDAKKGARFSKLVKEIQVAARTGGTSPSSNPRLRTAVDTAQTEGLPKDTIERAIERGGGTGEETKLEEFLYEAAAPGGIMILIEGITDSKNRTHAEVKHILFEKSSRFAEPGSLVWNFEKVGMIEFENEAAHGKNEEEIVLTAIDAGATDVKKTDTGWIIETPFESCDTVRKNFEAVEISPVRTRRGWKAKTLLSFPEVLHVSLEPLLESLLDHDDVQKVYTNLRSGL